MAKFHKQLPALVLAAVLILCTFLMPAQAEAAEVLYSGTCGENLTWTLDSEGTLTISGTGSMPFFEYGETPWKLCSELIEKVVVEDGVDYISSSAFMSLSGLNTVEIAGSVKSIESYAFQSCTTLTSVTLAEGVQELGWGCFSSCSSLRQITLPASVTLLESYTFFASEKLEEVTFLGDAPEFGSDVFRWDSLTAYYPLGNETWTADVRQGYGGFVTWKPTCVGEHAWTGWYVIQAPECFAEGTEQRFCMECSRFEDRSMGVASHQWGDWTQDTVGQIRTCGLCEASEYAYDAPWPSRNQDKHFYPKLNFTAGTGTMYYQTIKSCLVQENGGYMRVEYIGDVLVVEYYDAELNYLSGRGFSLELPIYGGVYIGEDYNFVVTGQKNIEEDNSKEVIRITRYTKDWVRVDDANLYGGYTTIPFDAGTVRFARSGDMLYVRTCHEMYTSDDGLNHQANVSLSVYIPTMEITDSNYTVSNASSGYVSHSFNQFVIVDGDDYIAVDHGDAYPRSVVMFRCQNGAGVQVFPYSREEIDVLPIAEATCAYQFTGVGVGGLAASSSHYIVVGNSADQSQPSDFRSAHRNIFVTATPKDDFSEAATQVHWLTSYTAEDGIELSPPHLVKLGEDRFLLIWTENDELRHCFLNGKGQLDSEIYENTGALSDCVPFLDGDRVLWYVTGGYELVYDWMEACDTEPVFYQIDLAEPGVVSRARCEHAYESVVTDPTCTEDGYTTHTCTICGDRYVDALTESLGHSWGEWEVVEWPTTQKPGKHQRVCGLCGESETEELPVLEFYYGDVNGDENVNVKDAILLRQYLAGWDVPLDMDAADVNGDDAVNTKDVVLLRQYLAGWDVALGPGE